MYCIKCGVELADSEQKCPLCNTHVFHPDISRSQAERPYPENLYPPRQVRPWGMLVIITMLFLLPLFISLICDLQLNGQIRWSGYVVGALAVTYVLLILPQWFRKANPVIFVPVDFAAIALYLLYINLVTGGGWYLTFALPVTGGLGFIVTAVVTLTRYIHRGRLFVYGGAAIALGIFSLVMELLLDYTFGFPVVLRWSLYPMTALFLLGITLLAVACCRPLRESLGKRLFI